MKAPYRIWNILGAVIFILSFLLGMVFIGLTVWGDLEANAFWGITEAANYDRQTEIDARLNGLDCPLLITRRETGTVVAQLDNPLDEPIRVILQAHFSKPTGSLDPLQDLQQFELSPQERREIAWTVGLENLKYNRLILVRVYLIDPSLRIPARTAHCGILVMDAAGLSSNQIVLISVAASLVGLVLGLILWIVGKLPLKNRLTTFGMLALAGVTLLGILATLAGFWIVAGGLMILNLIIIYSIFENMI